MSKKNRNNGAVSLNSFAALAALLPPTKQVEVEAPIIDNREEVAAVTPPPAPTPAPAPAPAPVPVVDWEEEMDRIAAARAEEAARVAALPTREISLEEWAAQWVAREAERLITLIQNGSMTRSLTLAFEAVGSTPEEFRGEIPRVLEAAKTKALAWMYENDCHVRTTSLRSKLKKVREGSDAHLEVTRGDSDRLYEWLQHGDDRNQSRIATTLEWFLLEELGVPYEEPGRHRVSSSSEWTPDSESWAGAFMSAGGGSGRHVNRQVYGETEPRRFQ